MSNREKDKIEKPGHIYITFPEDINSLTHTRCPFSVINTRLTATFKNFTLFFLTVFGWRLVSSEQQSETAFISQVCVCMCVCVGVRCFLPSLQPCLFVVNNNLISSDVKKRLSHCCRQTADCPCKYVGQQQSTSPLVILVIHTHTHFGFGLFLPANWTKLRLSQPSLAPAVLFSTRAGQSVLSQLSASRDTNRSMQVFYRRHQPLLYFQRHSLNRLS